MKKVYIAFTCMLGLFATTSCDDFLDVQPKGEKVEEDLFSTYKGFESAIYGVYGSMSDNALYGCDLLWGTTELLAQNLYSTSTYGQDMGQYEYSRNQASRDRIGRIWTTAYISIGYANNVIKNLDEKGPGSMPNWDLYKGEMLGVRALLHFDLLRMFAPAGDESLQGIPYVSSYSFSVKPFLSVGECYDAIIADLTEAEKLLTDDETLMAYPRDNDNYDRYLNWRETHMNLYAVKGLLARVYWYRGDMTNAGKYAAQVIDKGYFPLVQPTEIKDYLAGVLSPKETVFGIYSTTYLTTATTYLYQYVSYSSYEAYDNSSGSNKLEPWQSVYNLDVDVTAQDYRRNHFSVGNSITFFDKLTDYKTINNISHDGNFISGMTVMHSSELYLIAAEAFLSSDYNRALRYFNTEITSRGLPALMPDQTLTTDRIYNEYRKELFGEGQQWFNMKRLNRDIVSNNQGRVIPASDAIYVLPMPDEEYDYRDE